MRRVLLILAGCVLAVAVTANAQGPFTAQIQRAIDALLAGTNNWTGATNTFTGDVSVIGTCTGCGEGVPDAYYLLQTPNSDLVNAVSLSTIASGLLVNTFGTGLSGVYAGTACTQQVIRALNNSAAASCVTITNAYVDTTIALTGGDISAASQVVATHLSAALPIAQGGTALTTWTVNRIVYASATNTLAGLATANNGVLITSAGGVPSISSTIPAATQANITATGTIATGLWNGTLIGTVYGGTGLNTSAVTDGQVLIGRSSDNTWVRTSLTAGSNITITPGGGTISIAAASGTTGCALVYTAKAALYTAVANDLVAATSGTFTVTLPAASSNANKCIGVVNNGTGTTTVGRTGGDTVGLATTQTLNPATASAQGDSMIFWSDGISNWNIM